MTRRLTAILIALTAALALAATALASYNPATTRNPAAFVRSALLLEARGQYNRSWALLHPAEQKILSRTKYISCMHENHPRRIASVGVLAVSDTTIMYDSIPQHAVKAVTVSVNYQDGGQSTFTMSAVPVGGGFRWVLSPQSELRARFGTCPY